MFCLLQKTAVAVAVVKRGKGLLKLNGEDLLLEVCGCGAKYFSLDLHGGNSLGETAFYVFSLSLLI